MAATGIVKCIMFDDLETFESLNIKRMIADKDFGCGILAMPAPPVGKSKSVEGPPPKHRPPEPVTA